MAISSFTWALRFARILAGIFLFVGCGLTLVLLGGMADAATDSVVRLSLRTDRPAQFEFWYAMQAGYEDGAKHQPRHSAWDKLPALQLAPGRAFDLVANPITPLLRYPEPSAPKRLALLALGALPGAVSVPGLLFWIYGSWLLLKLVQDVTPETPFTEANARRLARLALLVLGLSLWDYAAQACVLALVPAFRAVGVASSLNHYVQLSTEELPGFQVGFMLSVIAAVYRRGVVLSQEAELVI
ncbi:DUF2975 domain-containing protein [Hymenobacter sp. RP-2-7]|uniref:DUF2975 domain-containing protein n=1 Tax=Hymenobacter polaris TaxID=2682546 RepID=A0A7Y0AFD8_9BACT|nr:DUF2975 domain-containing protein [Hymenobacter polaris]NML66065.1 DUF2975 domain-containing protein [Hymenobacter polaris]